MNNFILILMNVFCGILGVVTFSTDPSNNLNQIIMFLAVFNFLVAGWLIAIARDE
jgi:hypothetical protein